MNRCELYLVSDVVESGRIGKLHVGDDQEDICQEIKGFVLNPQKFVDLILQIFDSFYLNLLVLPHLVNMRMLDENESFLLFLLLLF